MRRGWGAARSRGRGGGEGGWAGGRKNKGREGRGIILTSDRRSQRRRRMMGRKGLGGSLEGSLGGGLEGRNERLGREE